MTTGAFPRRSSLAMSVVCSLGVLVAGCSSSAIRDIEFLSAPVGPSGLPEIQQGSTLAVLVRGDGPCNALSLNFGDLTGWFPQAGNPAYDLGNPRSVAHLYKHNVSGGPSFPFGRMTVTAHGDGNDCIGEVKKKIVVLPEHASIAAWPDGFLNARPSNGMRAGCSEALDIVKLYGFPFFRGMVVGIRAPGPDPGLPGNAALIGQIDYGPYVTDADGLQSPYSIAGVTFTFATPPMRPYSLVIIAGSQVVQGGKSMAFTIADPTVSELHFCLNADAGSFPMGANKGALLIEVVPDWSNAP